jgi:ATP-dependent DNA ligase
MPRRTSPLSRHGATLALRLGGDAAALPEWIRPQLTQLVQGAPEGDQWLHEIKFDGFRMHARLDRGEVRLLTRNGLNSRTTCAPGCITGCTSFSPPRRGRCGLVRSRPTWRI